MTKKKKTNKGQKPKDSKPGANGIAAPLPHSRIDYSKFDYIDNSDEEDEESERPGPPHDFCDPSECMACMMKEGVRPPGMFQDDPFCEHDEDTYDAEEELPKTTKMPSEALSPAMGSKTASGAASKNGTDKSGGPAKGARPSSGLKPNFFASRSTLSSPKPDQGTQASSRQAKADTKGVAKQAMKTEAVAKGETTDSDDGDSLPPLVSGKPCKMSAINS